MAVVRGEVSLGHGVERHESDIFLLDEDKTLYFGRKILVEIGFYIATTPINRFITYFVYGSVIICHRR